MFYHVEQNHVIYIKDMMSKKKITCNTYERFFRKITASDHPFVVHDVRVTHLFAHTVNNKNKNRLKRKNTSFTRCFDPNSSSRRID